MASKSSDIKVVNEDENDDGVDELNKRMAQLFRNDCQRIG